jgi:hypothetical protein
MVDFCVSSMYYIQLYGSHMINNFANIIFISLLMLAIYMVYTSTFSVRLAKVKQ